jgi:hypothetical protein
MKNPSNRLKLEIIYFRCKLAKKFGNKKNQGAACRQWYVHYYTY